MPNLLFPRCNGRKPLVIGLLGGVASGKSLVASELARRGAVVLDADRAAHAVLAEPEVQAALRQRWGQAVFGPDGQPDRKAIAQRVFGSSEDAEAERQWLQGVTHPSILRKVQREAADAMEKGAPMVVVDAALLLEARWDEFCDHLLFVDATESARAARAARRGWTPDELAAREAAQASLALKRSRADLIIDNTGTPEDTIAQIARLWSELRRA